MLPLVSSFDTVGRASRSKWPRRDMTVPDLSNISLAPQLASDSVATASSSSPSVLDLERRRQQLQRALFAMNRPVDLPSSASSPLFPNPPSDSSSPIDLLSLKLRAQRQAALCRAVNLRQHYVSPLSPQESSTVCHQSTSANTGPYHVDSYRFLKSEPCVQSQPTSSSYRAPQTVLNRDVQFPDLPIVRGPAAFQSSAAGASLQNCRSSCERRSIEDGGDGRANEESKRLKRSLEDLERELLGDDTDLVSSVIQTELPSTAELPERDWTDVIEDLLSGDSPSFTAQTVESSSATFLDQSTITCSSSMRDQCPEETADKTAVSQQQRTPQSPVRSLRVTDATDRPQQLLLACATAIDQDDLELATSILASLKLSSSIYGDPMQRLAAYMAQGLAAKIEGKALNFKSLSSAETLPATQVLYNWCPYFKFGYMAANGAIAEAFRTEPKVHIIDFEIGMGNQWPTLIGAFSRRPAGPPHVRLTGVDDATSPNSPVGGLEAVGQRLRRIARDAGVPFEFNPLPVDVSQVQPWMLETKPGEALAVNFAFQLHHMPDESVSTVNPRDRLLRMVRAMDPKVVTLVEHEANTNTAPFLPRFKETVSYFTAVFESLDAPLPRESKDRVNAEQHLARDVANIIACEGSDRVERYECAGKWRARMSMAGFRPRPLSSFINKTIQELLQHYSCHYRLREDSGTLYLDWRARGLIVASAWQLK